MKKREQIDIMFYTQIGGRCFCNFHFLLDDQLYMRLDGEFGGQISRQTWKDQLKSHLMAHLDNQTIKDLK